MPSEAGVRRVEEQFLPQLGAVGFCACASSIQTGDGVDGRNDGERGGQEEVEPSILQV